LNIILKIYHECREYTLREANYRAADKGTKAPNLQNRGIIIPHFL
jgi:hypothetical protein